MQFSFFNQTSKNHDTNILYDVIILGGGPAGLNASIYATRKGLKTLLIASKIGGQLENTKEIDNYLGFSNVSSETLINSFTKHVNALDIKLQIGANITKITKENNIFYIHLDNNLIYQSQTVIYALGSFNRKLNLPNENSLDKISYCAVCDAPFYKDLHVGVIGGGNSALEAALDLTYYASKVTIIQRSILRADQVLIDKVMNHEKIEIMLHTHVKSINGSNQITSLTLDDENKVFDFNLDGLFIEIGHIPNTKLVENLVTLDEMKNIITNAYQHTSLEGFYAAGDVTNFNHKQIIIAASQGATAALEVSKFLLNRKEEN